MAGGFSVDIGALQGAANGVNGILDQVDEQKLSAIKGSRAAVGHEHLAATVSDFCGRWQIGLDHLAKDGREIADRLLACAKAYDTVDRGGASLMDGILARPDGADPGAP